MTDIRFSQASNAYQDALRAAENIIQKSSGQETSATQESSASSSFYDMVSGALGKAAAAGYTSENTSMLNLTGKAGIADVVTAVNNAETALNTVVSIRDKMIGAYNDILKMQI